MTKQEHIYWVWNILDPSNNDRRWHYKQIEYAITKAYNQVCWNVPTEMYDSYEFLVKEYLNCDVLYDTNRALYYTQLPASVVPLRIPSEAVRHISSNHGTPALDFVPCSETTWELIDGLFSHDNDPTISYIVRNDRIWYNDAMTGSIAESGVRLVLAVQFSEFSDSDVVNLPAGDVDILSMSLQILQGVQPLNLKNNK